MNFRLLRFTSSLAFLLLFAGSALAQGVTTASIFGRVTDSKGEALPAATVIATHTPSGTRYGANTREDGRYNLPAVRVGGPYTVTVSYVGYNNQEQSGIMLKLGDNFAVNFVMIGEGISVDEVTITSSRSEVKNGASNNISNEVLSAMPTLNRRLSDFVRLTPQMSSASLGNSFGGQDNRMNNITLDGSLFNSSFGLGGQPGDRTGVAPISLDAIEEVQVNMAPFDVRQAGFTGAGINAITRSGTNDVQASVYYMFRSPKLLGDSARGVYVPRSNFQYYQGGFRVGAPIIKDKLFFFASAEIERNATPATTFRPREANEASGGDVSRVLRTDLEDMSSFLQEKFGYATGPYNGYNLNTKADKFLARLDYNISEFSKVSLRYNFLNSSQDNMISNSSSLGFGGRQPDLNRFSFQNSNYSIREDIRSLIGEWNVTKNKFSNNLIVGFTNQIEDRGDFDGDPKDTRPSFPLVEIQDNGSTYMSFGNEPFTPYNQLSYKTFQISDNFTYYAGAHKLTAGFSAERMTFRNVFFPGSQSVYVYNSLADFYADANAHIATNGNRDTAAVDYARFQIRYSALPGGAEPVQPTKVLYTGLYVQDEWQVNDKLNVTGGIRVDVPFFAQTGFENPNVNEMDFFNPAGEKVKFNTAKLPNANPLFSPRVGFNFNASNDTRLRGGSGIFTGRPAFVWISNQIGNNGVLTGFTQANGAATQNYPFNPNVGRYIPENAAGQIPSSYELALTDPDFRFPQVWRSNLAIEQKLPLGILATAEVLYNKDVNAITYYNANLEPATNQGSPNSGTFQGEDNRTRFTDNRYNNAVVNAVVLGNTNQGHAYTLTLQLERRFKSGFYARAAYNYGQAKNLINAGSIAAGTWTGNPIVSDPNNPALAFSNFDQRHRVITALSYRKSYGGEFGGATQLSLFYEGANQGRVSYTYSGDMNGDGAFNNELIYIPENASDLVFEQYTASGATFTVSQQIEAFEAYINQDPYMNTRRGQYAERNGFLMPWLHRVDMSLIQDIFVNVGGKRNTLQFRADMLNFTNLLNQDWGISQSVINNRPVVARSTNAAGQPVYRFANLGNRLLSSTFRYNNAIADVWQLQLGVRYIFN